MPWTVVALSLGSPARDGVIDLTIHFTSLATTPPQDPPVLAETVWLLLPPSYAVGRTDRQSPGPVASQSSAASWVSGAPGMGITIRPPWPSPHAPYSAGGEC